MANVLTMLLLFGGMGKVGGMIKKLLMFSILGPIGLLIGGGMKSILPLLLLTGGLGSLTSLFGGLGGNAGTLV